MKPIKFLIVSDKIRVDSVSYHQHLLTPDDKFFFIKGGGMVEFEYYDENKVIRFDSGSADYGTFKKFDLKVALTNTPDLNTTLGKLGSMVGGDDFDITKCKIFVREEEITL